MYFENVLNPKSQKCGPVISFLMLFSNIIYIYIVDICLILSNIDTLSGASATDQHFKHCGNGEIAHIKLAISQLATMFFQLFSNFFFIYRDFSYIFFQEVFKVSCCRSVVCGKGFIKSLQV